MFFVCITQSLIISDRFFVSFAAVRVRFADLTPGMVPLYDGFLKRILTDDNRYIYTKSEADTADPQAGLPCKSVKKRRDGLRKGGAGELEGARPASNWIGERPKKPISGFFGLRILPQGKIRARKLVKKVPVGDFFDKLKPSAEPRVPQAVFCCRGDEKPPCRYPQEPALEFVQSAYFAFCPVLWLAIHR